MTSLLLSLICSLIAYAVIFATTSGWGGLLARLSGADRDPRLRLFISLLGLCLILPITEVIHLVHRIDWVVSAVIVIPGLLLWTIKYGPEDLTFVRSHKRTVLIALLICCWAAGLGMNRPNNYDSGLYHFQSILWLHEFPIVRGLANLHCRLGFNQSYFELVAVADVYPWFNHGHNLVNSFLAVLLVSQCVSVATMQRGFARVFALLLLPALLLEFAGPGVFSNISSPTPDPISAFLQYSMLLLAVMHFAEPAGNEKLLICLPLAVCAITAKFSSLFFVTALLSVMIFISLRQTKLAQLIRLSRVAIIIPCLWLVLWCGRGLLLSGCPFYPLGVGRANFEWSVPPEHPHALVQLINRYTWHGALERQPESTESPAFPAALRWLSWVRTYRHTLFDITLVIPLCICCVALTLVNWRRALMQRELLLAPVLLFSITIWIIAAPDIRFGYQFLWMLAALLLALVIEHRPSIKTPIAVVYCIAALIACSHIDSTWAPNGAAVTNPIRRLLRVPRNGYQPVPTEPMVSHLTKENVEIFSPKSGMLAWKGTLPNTPYFTDALRLRSKDLKDGFYTNPNIMPSK